ncbi:hypothetical protein KC19_2G074400 [Ceratodon purpureus]|uniref:PDZ domain-containing protein n=1 Tax=Ceratodon purpureus TaxID=3225 RepID=A0A8T0ISY2_CERPU|nr:hypothetical protein KC19_2G074400 [Ceratodon purpureus]
MAGRWSAGMRQGLRFLGNWSNGALPKELHLEQGFRYRTNPSDEFGLRSVVVAGLVFCTTSGALSTEQSNGGIERDVAGEGVATPPYEGAAVGCDEAPRTLHPHLSGCSVENGTPITRVSNAFPLSGARATKDASAASPSPSNQGGYLSRFAIADAAARAAPAVVNVKVSIGRRNSIFGETAGSGFLIQSDGTILTNAHVVANERRGLYKGSLVVTLQDGRNFEGEVISFDSLSDLAVIKVNSSRPLPVVKLGTSKDLRPGEWVVALGSPLHLQNTVTAGIISCVDRKSSEIGLEGVGTGYIQTDAAINQGNSGGPLLNLDGEVIGINTMKALAADGVSFAIPIDSAIKIVDQLKNRRHVVRPWLGMKMWELTEPRILQLKERRPGFPNVTSGVLVSQVIPGSPAFRAGVHSDDVIVEFDGVPVTTINQIVEALGDKVGISFKMVVKRRNDEQLVLYVTAEEASPDI